MKFLAGIALGGLIVLGAGALQPPAPVIASSAHAGIFSEESDEKLPVRMKLLATSDSRGEDFRVWEDTQSPGVTCYKSNNGLDCVYIPQGAK